MPFDARSLYDDLYSETAPGSTTRNVRQGIIDEAQRVGIDPALALSLAQRESNFNPAATSPTGVVGLFQVQKDTGQKYGQAPVNTERAKPEVSTKAGLGYLRDLLIETKGDVPKALMRYNGGSDPNFAQNVLQHYPAQRASLQGASAGAGGRNLMASRTGDEAPPPFDARSVWDDLYGPKQPPPQQPPPSAPITPQTAPPASTGAPAPQTPSGLGTMPPTQMTIDVDKVSSRSVLGDLPRGLPLDASWIPQVMTSAAPPAGPIRANELATAGAGTPPAQDPRTAVPTVLPFGWDASVRRFLGGEEPVSGPRPPTVSELARGGAATAINMTGSGLGAAGGAAIGSMAGPAGTVAGGITGEMLGGFGAHKLNQYLGLEPGDPTSFDPTLWPPSGDVLALAAPPVARGVQAAIPRVVPRIPGAAAALNEEGMQRLQRFPQGLAPARPSADLYAEFAAGTNPAVAATEMRTSAAAVRAQEMALQPSYRNNRLVRQAQDLENLAARYGGDIPLDQLYDHQQRVGLLIRQASAENWPNLRGLNQLYGGIAQDIEAAAARGVPEAQTLRQAMQAFRRESAVGELEGMLQLGAGGIQTRKDGLITLNGGKIRDRLNKQFNTNQLFADSFTPAERAELFEIISGLEKLPPIPPQRGVAVGSSLFAGRTGAGYLVGKVLAPDEETARAIGIAAGAIPPLIAQAFMSRPGRAFLRDLIRRDQPLSPVALAGLRSVLEQSGMTGETAVPTSSGYVPPQRGTPMGTEGSGSR